jgi:hypothetical protein
LVEIKINAPIRAVRRGTFRMELPERKVSRRDPSAFDETAAEGSRETAFVSPGAVSRTARAKIFVLRFCQNVVPTGLRDPPMINTKNQKPERWARSGARTRYLFGSQNVWSLRDRGIRRQCCRDPG